MKTHQCIITMLTLGSALISSCENKDNPMPTPNPTIEITDSLTMVEFYHSMKGEEWEEEWDLTDSDTWRGTYFKKNEKGLKVVNGITIMKHNSVEQSVIPASIKNLKHLKNLYILDSPMATALPGEIFECDSIGTICIERSKNIKGPLSPKIGQNKIFRTLRIHGCPNFKSELPPEIGNCRKDAFIDLFETGFYGKIPFEIGRIAMVRLSKNHFTDIDWRLFTEYNLYIPYMSWNDFSGKIPEEVFETQAWKEYGYRLKGFNEGFGFENYQWEPTYNY